MSDDDIRDNQILDLQDTVNHLKEKISELEKKYESLDMEKKLKLNYMLKINQLEKNDKAHQSIHEKNRKEIAELREEQKKGWEDYSFLQGSQIKRQDYLDEQLNELKEKMKIYEGATINYNFDYDRIRQVREVLRELIKSLLVQIDSGKITHGKMFMGRLLEKLDGKKEVPNCYGCVYFNEIEYCWAIKGKADPSSKLCTFKKDSGGEKAHSGNLGGLEKSKITENSKLPEPWRCPKCQAELQWVNDEILCDCGYKDEPRENDYTTLDKSCNCCGEILYAADSISCSECSRKNDKEIISEFVEDLKLEKEWLKADNYEETVLIEQHIKKWEDKIK